jgi:hypothetical protein
MKPLNVLKILSSIEIFLTLAFLINMDIIHSSILSEWFHMDKEGTITSWFSSMQLLTVAVLFYIASRVENKLRVLFLICAGVLVFFSADEAAGIHERVAKLLVQAGIRPVFGWIGPWIILYPLVAIVGLLIVIPALHVMWREHRQPFELVVLGSLVFIFGAVGMECIGWGVFSPIRNPAHSIFYAGSVAVEEFCEMLGVSIALYGVLTFVLEHPTVSSKVTDIIFSGSE